jgi:hypothetical protein
VIGLHDKSSLSILGNLLHIYSFLHFVINYGTLTSPVLKFNLFIQFYLILRSLKPKCSTHNSFINTVLTVYDISFSVTAVHTIVRVLSMVL